jgi:hypothetical protein
MVRLLLLDSSSALASVVAPLSAGSSWLLSEAADVSVLADTELLGSGTVKQLDIARRENSI